MSFNKHMCNWQILNGVLMTLAQDKNGPSVVNTLTSYKHAQIWLKLSHIHHTNSGAGGCFSMRCIVNAKLRLSHFDVIHNSKPQCYILGLGIKDFNTFMHCSSHLQRSAVVLIIVGNKNGWIDVLIKRQHKWSWPIIYLFNETWYYDRHTCINTNVRSLKGCR